MCNHVIDNMLWKNAESEGDLKNAVYLLEDCKSELKKDSELYKKLEDFLNKYKKHYDS